MAAVGNRQVGLADHRFGIELACDRRAIDYPSLLELRPGEHYGAEEAVMAEDDGAGNAGAGEVQITGDIRVEDNDPGMRDGVFPGLVGEHLLDERRREGAAVLFTDRYLDGAAVIVKIGGFAGGNTVPRPSPGCPARPAPARRVRRRRRRRWRRRRPGRLCGAWSHPVNIVMIT